jgi:hypothetical protein
MGGLTAAEKNDFKRLYEDLNAGWSTC